MGPLYLLSLGQHLISSITFLFLALTLVFSSVLKIIPGVAEIESVSENYLGVIGLVCDQAWVETNLLPVGPKFTSKGPAQCPRADLGYRKFLRGDPIQQMDKTWHHESTKLRLPSFFAASQPSSRKGQYSSPGDTGLDTLKGAGSLPTLKPHRLVLHYE